MTYIHVHCPACRQATPRLAFGHRVGDCPFHTPAPRIDWQEGISTGHSDLAGQGDPDYWRAVDDYHAELASLRRELAAETEPDDYDYDGEPA